MLQKKSVDGVSTAKLSSSIKLMPQNTVKATPKITPKQAMVSREPRAVNSNSRRTQQKSTTLMRKYVKKPTTNNKTASISTFKAPAQSPIRASRALNTMKSPYINRYGATKTTHVAKRTEQFSVKNAPIKTPAGIGAKISTQKPITKKPLISSVKPSKSEQLFSDAFKNTGPTKPLKKAGLKARKKRSKAFKWSSGMASALLLIGFIAYLNLPAINIKIASNQAGFSAELPGYQPSGYSQSGPVSHDAGKVAINFKSNTDDRTYSIKQEVSNWNSRSLEENVLTSKGKNFTTSQADGKTVYFYDNGSSATWVNGGIWYQVESTSLSGDQLLKIASSL